MIDLSVELPFEAFPSTSLYRILTDYLSSLCLYSAGKGELTAPQNNLFYLWIVLILDNFSISWTISIFSCIIVHYFSISSEAKAEPICLLFHMTTLLVICI